MTQRKDNNFHQWSYQDIRLVTQQVVKISPLGLACGASVALGWLSGFKFCHPIVRSLHYTDVETDKDTEMIRMNLLTLIFIRCWTLDNDNEQD